MYEFWYYIRLKIQKLIAPKRMFNTWFLGTKDNLFLFSLADQHISPYTFFLTSISFTLSLSLLLYFSLSTHILIWPQEQNKRVKTRQMNLQGALDEKYIRIYVAHETTACNTWPLFRPNIFLTNQSLSGYFYRFEFHIFLYYSYMPLNSSTYQTAISTNPA